MFQWNLNRNSHIFIQDNAFEDVGCKMSVICLGLNVFSIGMAPSRRQYIAWSNGAGTVTTSWGPIYIPDWSLALQWRHNEHDSVSNHQPHDCLLNGLFGRRSKKKSKLRGTGLCAANSPETGEFPAQMASNAENVSIWWRHHGVNGLVPTQLAPC